MTVLVLGLVIFLGVHCVSIVAPRWRDRSAARLGDGPWRGGYSLVAAVGLVLIVVGYGTAREAPVVLYTPPPWTRQLALALMSLVFPLLLAAYFPGWIKSVTKHPMLVAVKLWAVLHLITNGTLADAVLFGSLLIWAVADRISLKRRVPRPVPSVGPPSKRNDAIAIVAGLAIYAAFVLGGHRWLIGVPASPAVG
jgi:uncharacterized membrane protein